jgi:hypothetical protein
MQAGLEKSGRQERSLIVADIWGDANSKRR